MASEGYEFVGWEVVGANTQITDPNLVPESVTESVTYVAKFELAKATIKYVANNGGTVGNSSESIYILSGTPVGSIAIPSEGYEFVNWTDPVGKVVSTSPYFVPEKVNDKNVTNIYVAYFTPIVVPHVHTAVTIPAVDATCEEDGLTAGSKCSSCGEILTERTTVAKLGHDPVKDAAVDPTYTTTGLTEGTHCSRCSKVLTEQTVIPVVSQNNVTIFYAINYSDRGTVSTVSETVAEYTGTLSGCIAYPKSRYMFESWQCNGVTVSTDQAFLPTKNADGKYVSATYTACFTDDPKYASETEISFSIQSLDNTTPAWSLSTKSMKIEAGKNPAEVWVSMNEPGHYFKYWKDDTGSAVSYETYFTPVKKSDGTYSDYYIAVFDRALKAEFVFGTVHGVAYGNMATYADANGVVTIPICGASNNDEYSLISWCKGSKTGEKIADGADETVTITENIVLYANYHTRAYVDYQPVFTSVDGGRQLVMVYTDPSNGHRYYTYFMGETKDALLKYIWAHVNDGNTFTESMSTSESNSFEKWSESTTTHYSYTEQSNVFGTLSDICNVASGACSVAGEVTTLTGAAAEVGIGLEIASGGLAILGVVFEQLQGEPQLTATFTNTSGISESVSKTLTKTYSATVDLSKGDYYKDALIVRAILADIKYYEVFEYDENNTFVNSTLMMQTYNPQDRILEFIGLKSEDQLAAKISELNCSVYSTGAVDRNGTDISGKTGHFEFTDLKAYVAEDYKNFKNNVAHKDGYTPIFDQDGLKSIGSNLTGKYQIMDNIYMTGNWEPLGSFDGILDGCGAIISNFHIDKVSSDYDTCFNGIGLFKEIGYSGSVKNITFQNVCIVAAMAPGSNGEIYIRTGTVCGTNRGTISGVTVNGGIIEVHDQDWLFVYSNTHNPYALSSIPSVGGNNTYYNWAKLGFTDAYSHPSDVPRHTSHVAVGGIAGQNLSMIKDCHVKDVSMKGKLINFFAWADQREGSNNGRSNGYLEFGCIAGYMEGDNTYVENCTSESSSIDELIWLFNVGSKKKGWMSGANVKFAADGKIGGLVGWNKSDSSHVSGTAKITYGTSKNCVSPEFHVRGADWAKDVAKENNCKFYKESDLIGHQG